LASLVVSGCAHVPELGDLSHLAPRERPRSVLATIDPVQPALSLNDLQLKGSHNSYHRAPRFALSRTWRYSHAPLEVQLASQGVRQLELDVRYARGELHVGHLPLVDGRSNCVQLHDCLSRIKKWSREHPRHLPVFVFIEVKDALAPARLDGKLELIDRAITKLFSRHQLLVPEDVAGSAPSLSQAIEQQGWPSVEESRGRIAFVMFGGKRHKRAYSAGRPRLDGRMMFVAERKLGAPHTSVLFYDDPIGERARIAEAVGKHYLVRTRADKDQRRHTSRRDAALSSGANFVSTDYADPRFDWVELGGGDAAARCNPLSASRDCSTLALSERIRPALAEVAPLPAQETPTGPAITLKPGERGAN